MSVKEIESFLDINFQNLNKNYFLNNFNKYANLCDNLNVLEVISFISFDQSLKKRIKSLIAKNISYPIFLIFFGFFTLTIFKFSLLPLLSDFSITFTIFLVNVIFYFSIIFFILIFLLTFLLFFTFSNPAYFILIYYKLYQFRLFKTIELYYLSILSHLLISFDKEGLSTQQTFKLINKFKNNTIIANLAYFVSANLESGNSFNKSIEKMQVSKNFKNILLLGIKSGRYQQLLHEYQKKTVSNLKNEILFISKVLSFTAYMYIAIIIVLLYKIISIPLEMLNMM